MRLTQTPRRQFLLQVEWTDKPVRLCPVSRQHPFPTFISNSAGTVDSNGPKMNKRLELPDCDSNSGSLQNRSNNSSLIIRPRAGCDAASDHSDNPGSQPAVILIAMALLPLNSSDYTSGAEVEQRL